jgi:hyaluronate lyase
MALRSNTFLRLAFAGCLALASLLARADDYDVLRDRWQLRLTGGPRGELGATASAEAQRSWRSMDVSAGRQQLWPDLADWSRSATVHENYRRVRAMALAYRQPGSALHANPELAQSIVNALDWLDAHHYNPSVRYHDNWWHWQIGVPLVLDDIATLMYGELGEARLRRYLAAIDHFVPDPATHLMPDGRVRPDEETGANRLDKALAVALRGILGKSGEKVAAGRDAISQTLVYVDHGDGFYRDGSFIQHSYVPYAGGYGQVAIADMAQLLYLFKDSRWAIRDPNVSNVYAWVENSFRPFIFNGVMIDAVSGRKVSRRHEDDVSTARSVMGSLALLAQGAPKEQADAIRGMVRGWQMRDPGRGPSAAARPAPSYEAALLDAIAKDESIRPADEPVGARLFPSQDRVVLRAPGFAWSLSLFSDRISAFEAGNEENLRGWWTGMGMAQLYQGGPSPHADGYWATVDLQRLPGTTTDHSGQGKPKFWFMSGNTSAWVGGAATPDGQAASVGMAFSTARVTGSRLQGRKSWFLFGDRILAMGAGISTPDPLEVETIVDNRLLDAAHPRTLSIDGKAQPDAANWKTQVPAAHWAHLGGGGFDEGVGYVFPGSTRLSAWREEREGRWFDVNQGAGTGGDAESITRTYAGLSLEHGAAPANATYAYIVLPGRSAAQTAAFSAKPSITVLANNAEVSAACDARLDVIGANVWAPLAKPLQVGGRDWLRADAGMALVARHRGDALELSLSDPTQHASGIVHVELDEPVEAVLQADPRITVERTAPTLRLALRLAGLAGQSVHAQFQRSQSGSRAPRCPANP